MTSRVCSTCHREVSGTGAFCPDDGTPLLIVPRDLVGTLVAGRYRVLRRLGEGGMGEVFLAQHEAIEKRVALKVLRRELSEKADVVARFQQEAKSASRIKHPNVVDVFDFGQTEDGRSFLALEYLDGRDLAAELARGPQLLDRRRVIHITLQVASALAAAHARGVIHRDLKPENVFLQNDERGDDLVKIVDFGIAKLREYGREGGSFPPPMPAALLADEISSPKRLTRAGTIFGTPEYMAPEQAAGRDVDARADIYAVGILLYEMLTGRVPFIADTLIRTLTLQINEKPLPMRAVNPAAPVSDALEAVVAKALEKNPADRYPSMTELAQALVLTPEGAGQTANPLAARGSMGSIPGASPSGPDRPSPQAVTLEEVIEPGAPTVAAPMLLVPKRKEEPDTRSETTYGVEPPSRIARSKASMFAVGLLALCALGAGGAIALRATGTNSAYGAREESTASATRATPVDSAPVPAPAGGVAEIVLHVTSDPPGAVVRKAGFQVCDATPCDVKATVDEAIELSVEKGELKGVAKVLAQREQSVTVKLARPSAALVPPAPPPRTSAAPPRQAPPVRMCEVMVGDLKVVRPCP
jgi:eukaryotic-like serine/threonine-protein kinase